MNKTVWNSIKVHFGHEVYGYVNPITFIRWNAIEYCEIARLKIINWLKSR